MELPMTKKGENAKHLRGPKKHASLTPERFLFLSRALGFPSIQHIHHN